jgi:site-specific DNA recombinase
MVNNELKVTRPRYKSDQYMIYDGKHKQYALVDEETFKAVQNRYHSDRSKSNVGLKNPLAGLMSCKHCGRSMFLSKHSGKRNNRYTHTANTEGCKLKSASYPDVIAAVSHALKMYIEDFELKIEESSDIDTNTIEMQIENLRKEMAKIKRKKAKLFDSWEDEDITDNEFVERKAIHNQNLESLQQQIDELEYTVPEKEEYEEKLALVSDAFIAINDDVMDIENKNMFLKKIIKQIEFSRENNDEFILDIDLH